MNVPKISLIVPIFNRFKLFQELVDSLIAQTEDSWEAIIVDDGSEPKHLDAIQKACSQDARISLYRRKSDRKGAPVCRNEGIGYARGRYLMFYDSDDVLERHALEDRVEAMEAHPEIDFGVFQCEIFRERPGDAGLLLNKDTEEDDFLRLLRQDCPWCVLNPVYTREAVERIGPWNEGLLSWQDWEYHLRALLLGLRYRKFGGGLAYCRREIKRRESIGRSVYSDKHVRSHIVLLEALEEMIKESDRWSAGSRGALAGLYFWHARIWYDLGQKKDALSLWKKCRNKDLVNSMEYLAAIPYYPLPMMSLPGRLYRRFLRTLSPNVFFPVPTKTMMRTCVEDETKYPAYPERNVENRVQG